LVRRQRVVVDDAHSFRKDIVLLVCCCVSSGAVIVRIAVRIHLTSSCHFVTQSFKTTDELTQLRVILFYLFRIRNTVCSQVLPLL
jgi:hypothetical protein